MNTRNVVVKAVVLYFLFGAMVVSPVNASELACSEHPHESEPTRTFDVRVEVRKAVYQVGDVARFDVTVTRKLDGVVVGPADGANVMLGVSLDDVFLGGGSLTDSEGQAVVQVRLKSYLPQGSADVLGYANKRLVDLPCNSRFEYEFGDFLETNFFKVVR